MIVVRFKVPAFFCGVDAKYWAGYFFRLQNSATHDNVIRFANKNDKDLFEPELNLLLWFDATAKLSAFVNHIYKSVIAIIVIWAFKMKRITTPCEDKILLCSPNLHYLLFQVTIAIGGWNEGSKKYSEMVADPARRKRFVESVVAFCQEHNFDGLDLDWEYPGKRGGSPDDKENFVKLIRDLKEAFRPKQLLLTAAIGAAAPTIDVAYDIPQMYKYLDYVHVMCYDYHGKWDRQTGHNAPLYARPNEKGQDLFLNVEYTLKYLIEKGAKPEKTVLGVPLYGRAFSLMNPHDYKMGARAKTTSFQVRRSSKEMKRKFLGAKLGIGLLKNKRLEFRKT